MTWCPKCRIEYRDGFTECRECGAQLVDELAPLPPSKESDDRMKKRRPILAFLLSFFCRGLGQLYNGQSKRAIVFFSIEVVLLAILCMLFISTFGSFRGLLTTFAVATPIGIAYAIFVAVDAFKGARKIRELKLRRYNRWYIYAALLLAVYYVIDPVFVLHKSFRPYRIPSASMEPALLAGDCLTSDVRFYRRHKPQRGDIVIFIYPGDRTKDFIKRVIDNHKKVGTSAA